MVTENNEPVCLISAADPFLFFCEDITRILMDNISRFGAILKGWRERNNYCSLHPKKNAILAFFD